MLGVIRTAGRFVFPTLEATHGQIDGFFHAEATSIGWHLWEIDLIIRKAYDERGLPKLIPAWKVTFKFH